MMNKTPIGFKDAIEALFIAWLTNELLAAAYNALTLGEVRKKAEYDLGLSVEALLRLLIKHTAAGALFYSDGDIVTFREDAL
jgi:hypothetical protein